MRTPRVLFAPDWRNGVPYQRLLAEALAAEGVEVSFLSDWRRVFPLTRGIAGHPSDLLHMHWPEAYYPQMNDPFDLFRRARFAVDLSMAARNRPMVLTAHNLYPHNRRRQAFVEFNTRVSFERAAAVIAHSEAARVEVMEKFGLKAERCHMVPQGDLSVGLGAPVEREEARRVVGTTGQVVGTTGPMEGKLALMFGAVEPYKGIEEVLAFWLKEKPGAALAIIGKPISKEYAAGIAELAAGDPGIVCRFGWLADEQLRLWLSAADCVIFNYQTIFTSGAAHLARAFGVPLLLPERLKTVDVGEPSGLVFRFEGVGDGFGEKLQAALDAKPDYAGAAEYRERCAWNRVARMTAEIYRGVAR